MLDNQPVDVCDRYAKSISDALQTDVLTLKDFSERKAISALENKNHQMSKEIGNGSMNPFFNPNKMKILKGPGIYAHCFHSHSAHKLLLSIKGPYFVRKGKPRSIIGFGP